MTKHLVIPIGVLLVILMAASSFLGSRQVLRPRGSGQTSIALLPSATTVRPGEKMILAVTIDTGGKSVSAADLQIGYDAAVLSVGAVDVGDFLPVVLSPVKNTGSEVLMALGSQPTTPRVGQGTLVTLHLTILAKSGSAQVWVGPGTKVAAVGESGDVLSGKTNALITVVPAATSTPTPTRSLHPSPTASPRLHFQMTPTPVPLSH